MFHFVIIIYYEFWVEAWCVFFFRQTLFYFILFSGCLRSLALAHAHCTNRAQNHLSEKEKRYFFVGSFAWHGKEWMHSGNNNKQKSDRDLKEEALMAQNWILREWGTKKAWRIFGAYLHISRGALILDFFFNFSLGVDPIALRLTVFFLFCSAQLFSRTERMYANWLTMQFMHCG